MHSHQELGITNRRRDLPSPKAGILVTINYQVALHSAILLKTDLLGSGLNLSLLLLELLERTRRNMTWFMVVH